MSTRRVALQTSVAVIMALASTLANSNGDEGKAGSARWHYNIDDDHIAIEGYDPVAYHVDEQALQGDASITAEVEGVQYLFSSVENRDLFLKAPEKYLPSFGGWCALGVSLDPAKSGVAPRRIPPDPSSFKIVDGRLLLFSRAVFGDAKSIWDQRGDEESALELADAFWTSRDELAAEIGAKPDGMHRLAVMETAQFDFFIGEWESRYKVLVDPSNGVYSPEVRGHWKAWYGWDGYAIYDDWVQVGIPVTNSGPAVRSYDPLNKKWVMHYIPVNTPASGVWQMIGEFDDKGELHAEMKALDGQGREFLQRVHFVNIEQDHFSWRSDRSYDGGQTWVEDWGVGENKRIGLDD